MQSNHFQFVNAKENLNMRVLNAVMHDFSYADHAHEELAVGVTIEGVQEFSCNGTRFRSIPGNIILFNPGDVHDGHPGSDQALKYTMLYLDTRDFYPLMGCASGSDKKEFRLAETIFQDDILKSRILDASRLAVDPACLLVEYEQCLYKLAERLAQQMGVFSRNSWRGAGDTLLRVRDFIHDNIAGDISIDDLSMVANLSKYHFIRMFRSRFGLTPHQYILNLKVNRVRTILETGVPPSDAAQEFGFFDVSHLNRHFKRSYGVTPKQYQQQFMT